MPPSTSGDLAEGGRSTLTCQRSMFEQLKQQFDQTQKVPAMPETAKDLAASADVDRYRQLEDEVRQLRRENATLRTSVLSAQDENAERVTEVIIEDWI